MKRPIHITFPHPETVEAEEYMKEYDLDEELYKEFYNSTKYVKFFSNGQIKTVVGQFMRATKEADKNDNIEPLEQLKQDLEKGEEIQFK